MSTRSKENPGNQTTVSGHDYQKFEEIFHFRSNGKLSKSLYSVFINLFTVSTVFWCLLRITNSGWQELKVLLTLQVLDDKNVKRRFRASNYQSTTRVKPFICTMPMRLDDGWNQIQVIQIISFINFSLLLFVKRLNISISIKSVCGLLSLSNNWQILTKLVDKHY